MSGIWYNQFGSKMQIILLENEELIGFYLNCTPGSKAAREKLTGFVRKDEHASRFGFTVDFQVSKEKLHCFVGVLLVMVKLCNLLVIVLDSCLRICCSVSVAKILDPHSASAILGEYSGTEELSKKIK